MNARAGIGRAGLHARARIAALVVGLAVLAPDQARAQDEAAPTPAPSTSPTAGPVASASAPAGPKANHASTPEPAKRSAIDDLVDPGATPRRALTSFLRAAEARDVQAAAVFLDLRGVPPARRVREGGELAAMLHRVLTWSLVLDPGALPDTPEAEGQTSVVVDTIELEGQPVPIVLERIRSSAGGQSWKFSQRTVGRVRALYDAEDRRAIEQRIPDVLTGRTFWTLAPWQWIGLPILIAASWVIARLLGALVTPVLCRMAAKVGPAWLPGGVLAASAPLRLAIGVGAFRALAPYLMVPASAAVTLARGETILWALAGGWFLVAMVRAATRAATIAPEDTASELEHRGLRTRLLMIERVTTAAIGVVSVGVMLMQFEVVRTVGVSLLASAGVAGVVLGIAAQRTLGGVIGGIELAFTQPLRMGDTVVIDGQLGTVEQMFFTYVIVRCWDGRRLIVPITRLLSQPFENWTRSSPEMLVVVDLHADYRVPVAAVRDELVRLCKEHKLWDGRTASLQVLDTTERTVKLRGLASVDNASKSADMKSELREGLLLFLQTHEGGAFLPRDRMESLADKGREEGREAAKPEEKVREPEKAPERPGKASTPKPG